MYLSVHEDFHETNDILWVLGRPSKIKRTIVKKEKF